MNPNIVELHNAQYTMKFGCGYDTWSLCGNVFNHPGFHDGCFVHLSTPVHFNEQTWILTTASGRTYSIQSFYIDQDVVIQQIKSDIKNGGYETK